MSDLFALFRQSLAGLRVLIAATLITGLAYPLVVLGVARVAFPWQAEGSLVTASGEHTTDASEAVGSALLGQAPAEGLFAARPSAAGDGWDPLNTYGSNLGPESPELLDLVEQRRSDVAEANGVDPATVPADALTASASGLDPHITVVNAELQVARVAEAQGLAPADVRRLVADHTEGRTLGFLGEARVNVLELNLAVLRAARG